ncbi:hypothetical protein [Hoyosella subflava]|uniref:Uncharacterized protein n=1 Tax=Hoyosella subflava (strain DSM 45089 / JCM 17490 / NBRC 109087 / DQS3-9A1) TaxID=443218 RepID=F6EQ54_HOYSD|nr:hypothetical protein [Hoyosella subflava]AEF39477.1 hypothetical protein AS9A_1025 [Hoyosella subflava DQS3-9A1]
MVGNRIIGRTTAVISATAVALAVGAGASMAAVTGTADVAASGDEISFALDLTGEPGFNCSLMVVTNDLSYTDDRHLSDDDGVLVGTFTFDSLPDGTYFTQTYCEDSDMIPFARINGPFVIPTANGGGNGGGGFGSISGS